MPKRPSKTPVEMVEVDRTVHNLATHLDKNGGNETAILQGYNEDGTAKVPEDRTTAGHSIGWYLSWGTPAKCPTCGAPANVTNEPKE